MDINSYGGGINMATHVSKLVHNIMVSIGGKQCKICDEWDDKDRFVGPICCGCDQEIEEIIAEAEDW